MPPKYPFKCGSYEGYRSELCREREAHNKTADFYRSEIAQISQPLYCLHKHCERFGVTIGQRISEAVPQLLEAFEKAEAECKEVRAERDKWEETARLYCKNSEHHRNMREQAERERDEAREQNAKLRDLIKRAINFGEDRAPYLAYPGPTWEKLRAELEQLKKGVE
jgi:chromosome condensin MukBEF ATPase and DNA-binding subunit MukB